MLGYAITFFLVALLAGFFGFWGVAGLATEIAKILCLIFVVLAVVSMLRGRGTATLIPNSFYEKNHSSAHRGRSLERLQTHGKHHHRGHIAGTAPR